MVGRLNAHERVISRRRALAAGAGMATLLVACGPGRQAAELGPKAAGSGKTVTLRVGGRASEPSPSWDEFMAAKAVFEKKYPKITVEVTPSMNAEKFLIGAAAGDAWDVQDTCCDQIPLEARKGVLLKLDSWIKKGFKAEDVKDWIEWQYKFFNIDGAQYGIGKYMGTTSLYYNKNWFQQKGVAFPDETWDWNKYRDAMIRLTDASSQKWGGYLILSADRRQAKVLQNGGHFVDPKDDMKSMLDHPNTIEAFTWVHDRMHKDNAAIKRAEHLPALNARQHFTAGHVAMWEDGSWSLVPVVQDKPAFEWDVVTLPRGKTQRSVLATTDGWAMWNGSKSPEDAWLLFAFFNSDDWYDIQSKRLQPARLSWFPKWISMLTTAQPELKGKSLTGFTKPGEQGYGHPWELLRYHAATNQLINDAYEKSVNLSQAPIRDTHIELAKEVNEKQKLEHAAAGGSTKK